MNTYKILSKESLYDVGISLLMSFYTLREISKAYIIIWLSDKMKDTLN